MKKKTRYNKELVEHEAHLSVEQDAITNELGKFIYQRCIEISGSAFFTNGDDELKQALIDSKLGLFGFYENADGNLYMNCNGGEFFRY